MDYRLWTIDSQTWIMDLDVDLDRLLESYYSIRGVEDIYLICSYLLSHSVLYCIV
jgi:hypothetical protein